jgi:hypothetical protein
MTRCVPSTSATFAKDGQLTQQNERRTHELERPLTFGLEDSRDGKPLARVRLRRLMVGGGELVRGDHIEVGVEALGPTERSHPVRPRNQPAGIEHGTRLLLDLTHSGREQDPPPVGLFGDGRLRPRGGVHVRVGRR